MTGPTVEGPIEKPRCVVTAETHFSQKTQFQELFSNELSANMKKGTSELIQLIQNVLSFSKNALLASSAS
jgi:hypothetical protein